MYIGFGHDHFPGGGVADDTVDTVTDNTPTDAILRMPILNQVSLQSRVVRHYGLCNAIRNSISHTTSKNQLTDVVV